jgi:hypothetical protein
VNLSGGIKEEDSYQNNTYHYYATITISYIKGATKKGNFKFELFLLLHLKKKMFIVIGYSVLHIKGGVNLSGGIKEEN